MARYLLDSNAFLYAKFEPEKLRQEALETIKDNGNRLFVSVAGLWEIAIKAANGKLPRYADLIMSGPDGLRQALQESDFALLPIELEYALAAARLPQHHRDPFDRLMIAQALQEDLTVITTDATFARYAGLRLLAA
jgi:PIN domain nuclease of toxin-antitoxin system